MAALYDQGVYEDPRISINKLGEYLTVSRPSRRERILKPVTERFHCMAYPCPNLTIWFYMPAWSHLCMECMMQREATR